MHSRVFIRRVALPFTFAMLAVPAAVAQEVASAADSGEIAEVVVTGSRIARQDFGSDSPLVTLSSEALQNTGAVTIDQAISRLPQAGTGSNQFNSAGSIQVTPTASPGISTVNLRDLGSNRTLVLLDGRRTQPANASMVVDLNTIPAAAIESVEIITGGAGATYGADAVAGVVNFRLKQHFTGVAVDLQAGETFDGDGSQSQASVLIGADFADGRGNAMAGVSWGKRGVIWTRDRDFFTEAWSDPGLSGGSAFPNFGGFAAGNVVGGGGFATQAAMDTVFTARGYAAGDVRNNAIVYFNTAATTAAATLFSAAGGVVSGSPAPGFTGELFPSTKILNNGSLSSNTTEGFLSLPLERYSSFAKAYYGINDHATVYVQGNFQETTTKTQSGAFAPAVNQWGVTVPVDANHEVPDELQTLLSSRTSPTAPWGLNKVLDFVPSTSVETRTNTYEMLLGVKGSLGLRDWTYDVFAARGNTSANSNYFGFVDLDAYQTLINLPDYGANATFENARTGLRAHCTSGVNPFVNTPVSQDCIDILDSQLKTTTDLSQVQAEANIQGSVMELPAGDLRFAFGAAYRKNEFEYRPDRGISTQNITSLSVGLFSTTTTTGDIAVREGYVEFLVPVLKDRFLARNLTLNAGYRYSDYSTATGGVDTWKITGDWDINEWVKIRGGYQVANRAPNIAELFSPPVFTVVGWADHDPCSNITRAPWGNAAGNPDRAQVQALCTALADGFVVDDDYVGNQPVYFPLGRDLTQGNPEVGSEEAKTWTIGTVLRSPFEAGAVRNLTLAVDYYDIQIEGAITPASTAYVYQQCFNAFGTNPSFDPANDYCQRIIRNPSNGFWLATDAKYENLGAVRTSGIDAQLDWSMQTPFFGGNAGRLSANVNFNWLESYEVEAVQGQGVVLQYAGFTSTPYGSLYRWKLATTLGYSVGGAGVNLTWRHLPQTDHATLVTNPSSTVLPVKSYDIFDLTGRWTINDTFAVRAGIENLFDKAPPRVGVIPGTTTASGSTDSSYYDVIGRSFFVGVQMQF